MTLYEHLAHLAAVKRRDGHEHVVDRRKTRHRWQRPECAVCGGFGVLGSAKAYVRCPCCRRATR